MTFSKALDIHVTATFTLATIRKEVTIMFTVGEFSRLARVSKRLLRYYDEIGLLKPVHTDRLTGYRYYSAEQMPRLNRILALKDLGLSLDQIQRLLNDQVSTDEIQGMLLLKKAEIEQQVQEEIQRIRNIEARLQFLHSAEAEGPFDVVIKQIPAQPVLSVRTRLASLEDGVGIFGQIMMALPEKSGEGLFFAILHSDGIDEGDLDVEIGRTVAVKTHAPVPLDSGLQLHLRELPPVDTMATFIVKGPMANLLVGYSVIGTWAESNGYRLAGVPREVALQLPQTADWSDAIAEIQYPVEPVR
ncbi:MAG TPA: MerR family transcriptional regulator [Anaerolineales bacterium]|nr:MerR family transcriptional regulator [Anaerolineales bacterium]